MGAQHKTIHAAKGLESRFLREIPEVYTVRTGIPLPSVVEEVRLCPNCSRQIEEMFSYCPYCGTRQTGKTTLRNAN